MRKRVKCVFVAFLMFFMMGWIGFIHYTTAQDQSGAGAPGVVLGAQEQATVGKIEGISDKIAEIIASTPKCGGEVTKGCINPDAQRGYLGIPGAPKPSYILGVLWAIWVGWIFSTVGAFGGIMAGVGHITVFGLADYAKSFRSTNPTLNKSLTDSIRVSNQYLVGLSSLISTVNYAKMKRLIAPLGIAMGVGSVVGSTLVPILTAGKISLRAYIGYFGLAVFLVAGFMYYGTTERARAKRKAATEAAKRFEEAVKQKGDTASMGVQIQRFNPAICEFTFSGVEFKFNPILAALGGFVIAAIASFVGVGGGFLLVPFMTDLLKLPMFIVAGTSAFIVLIGMVVSIFNYMVVKSVMVWWPLIAVELIGVFIGSMIGPRTQKYIPDVWLKRIFVLLAIYVGIRYTSQGFLGYSIVPPY